METFGQRLRGFRKASGLDANTTFGLLDLAVQIYRESLLIKHLA